MTNKIRENENKYLAKIERMRARKKKNLLRKVKLGTAFCAVVVSLVLFFSVTVSLGKSNTDFTYITVKSGDTLWSIADRISDDRDLREVVFEIKQINDNVDILQPGEVIKVPN